MFFKLAIVLGSIIHLEGLDQNTIDYIASNLRIRYDVLDNFRDMLWTYEAQITLTNTGDRPILKDSWKIFFCHFRMIEHEFLPSPQGKSLPEFGIKFRHIQGCLFSIEPLDNFQTLFPGKNMKIRFLGENWVVSRTDLFPNWYVAAHGLKPKVITSTADDKLKFVGAFKKVEQWKRYDWKNEEGEGHDKYDPYTASSRYFIHNVSDLGGAPSFVLPSPRTISVDPLKTINVGTTDWLIVFSPDFKEEAIYLSDKLNIGMTTERPSSRFISLRKTWIDNKAKERDVLMSEAYELTVDSETESITIKAREDRGVFYGIQSLLHLISDNMTIANTVITDSPRYPYRGFMIDIARNFRTKGEILRLLDIMASYKLNTLHLHLTDDEGWRLEIPDLPELTEIGGRRCHDLTESKCILPQFGAGPNSAYPWSGHLTIEDYRDILRHAKRLHINVIPEVDMPGHGHSSIKAMAARQMKYLRMGNKDEAYKYSLVEENDPSKYQSIQMYTDNAVNPCLNSTTNFVQHVIKSLVDIHKDIMPLRTFHFGGDEVAKGAWENSTSCKLMKTRSPSVVGGSGDLKEYFANLISQITSPLGVDLAAWEDGFMRSGSNGTFDRKTFKNKHLYAYAWDNVWEWGQSGRAYNLANSGYKVVMAQATHLYFDHPYEPDPEEPGLYWAARYTDTKRTFSFIPENLYAMADVDRSGYKLTEEQMCGKERTLCPPLQRKENIAGLQGHLFGELIRSSERADYMVFPRFLALVERAWHEAEFEKQTDDVNRRKMINDEWTKFANTLGYNELRKLDKYGIKYRIPPPGAKVVGEKLVVNTEFPGLPIEYSIDGGATWCQASGDIPVSAGQKILLRTRSHDSGRTSRVVQVHDIQVNSSTNGPQLVTINVLCLLVAVITIQFC